MNICSATSDKVFSCYLCGKSYAAPSDYAQRDLAFMESTAFQ